MKQTNMRYLTVCPSPLQYQAYHKDGNLVVLIDVIRATTVICTALNHGAEWVLPLAGIEETLAMKAQGCIVAGERGSHKLEAFDLGNSPVEFTAPYIKGSRIAITTTNGTQALAQVPADTPVVAGAWVNMEMLVECLLNTPNDVMLLCSGWENTTSVEDMLFAGQVTVRLINSGKFYSMADSVFMAILMAETADNDELDFILKLSPRLKGKFNKLKEDVTFCLSKNTQPVLPVLAERKFVKKRTT